MQDKAEPATSEAERNKAFVLRHFEDFVNRRDLDAITRNTTKDFFDHDGPGGKPIDRDGDREMMAKLQMSYPDLRVEVRDILAEGDKVVCRNVWTATDPVTGKRIEFHGSVLWRFQGGRIAERWATVTPFAELAGDKLAW